MSKAKSLNENYISIKRKKNEERRRRRRMVTLLNKKQKHIYEMKLNLIFNKNK
jgi:hypothetical protein